MALKFYTDEKGVLQMKDGLPIVELEDGTKQEMDVFGTMESLTKKLKASEDEKQRHYTDKRTLQEQLENFKGIDPKKAKEALKVIKNLDDKKLLDADGIEAVKKELTMDMTKAFDEKEKSLKSAFDEERQAWQGERTMHESLIRHLVIDNRFAMDPHFSGQKPKTNLPPSMAAKIFGDNFDVKMVDGKAICVAKHNDGKPVMSKVKIGDPADFSEAIGILIDEHPDKTAILDVGPGGGPGARGNVGGAEGKKFENMTSKEKIAAGLKKHLGQM